MATIDFQALQVFVKVVQTGSFTRAADALGSQKAHLSRVLSQLEKQLGVRLLERTTRALSLTEVGREFYERAVGILASVDDVQRMVQQAQAQPQGTLRLTCGVEMGMIAVSGWVDRYLQAWPETSVEADFTSRLVDIVHEGFDLAIRVGVLEDSSLAARRLGDIQYGLFAAPAYLRSCAPIMQPHALREHPALVFRSASSRTTWTLSDTRQTQQVALRPRLQANNHFAVRDAAVAGLGVALLPWMVARSEVTSGVLQQVLPDWAPPSMPVHAVFASARYLTPKVRAFIDLAAHALQASAV